MMSLLISFFSINKLFEIKKFFSNLISYLISKRLLGIPKLNHVINALLIKTLDASVNNADVTLRKNVQHFNSNHLECKMNKVKCKKARLHKINLE